MAGVLVVWALLSWGLWESDGPCGGIWHGVLLVGVGVGLIGAVGLVVSSITAVIFSLSAKGRTVVAPLIFVTLCPSLIAAGILAVIPGRCFSTFG